MSFTECVRLQNTHFFKKICTTIQSSPQQRTTNIYQKSFLCTTILSHSLVIKTFPHMILLSGIFRTICGTRVRAELSTGKVRPKPWMRSSRNPPRLRRPFDPADRCYECGERGHYAYDCSRYGRRRGGGSRRQISFFVYVFFALQMY